MAVIAPRTVTGTLCEAESEWAYRRRLPTAQRTAAGTAKLMPALATLRRAAHSAPPQRHIRASTAVTERIPPRPTATNSLHALTRLHILSIAGRLQPVQSHDATSPPPAREAGVEEVVSRLSHLPLVDLRKSHFFWYFIDATGG